MPTGYEVETYRNIGVIAGSLKQIAKIMTAEAEAKAAAADDDSAREVLALIAGSPGSSGSPSPAPPRRGWSGCSTSRALRRRAPAPGSSGIPIG